MRKYLSMVLAVLAATLMAQTPTFAAQGDRAHADMIDSSGNRIGKAYFTETVQGVAVHLEIHGLTPGLHGVHIHNVGKADPPDFKTAGSHFNPDNHQHGAFNPQGHHMGDIPNLSVLVNGDGTLDYVIAGCTLGTDSHGLFHPGGTALVVHAKADDQVTDPIGNAGARVACGVIEH